MLQLNGITKTYLVGVQLFPDHCPPSPICLTDPTKVEWSSLSPSWRLAWTEVFGNIIISMRDETAHAQYTIMVKGGGCKKVMRALMRN